MNANLISPCVAEVLRPARENPGGPSSPAWLTVTMGGLSYRLLLDVPAEGTAEATNALADALIAGVQAASMEIASLRDRAERAEAARHAANAAASLDRERVAEVLTGQTRRLFGRALVVLDADGGCWLQDPGKGDHGMGLHYASLAELWRDMPSLRPVAWEGGRLIVESFAVSL